MRVRRSVLALMAAMICAAPGAARADTIRVTGGTVTLGASGSLAYDIVTDAATLLSNSPLRPWSAVGYSLGCASIGCAPGETLTFNNETAGTDFFGNPSGFADLGTATIDTNCCGSHPNTNVRGHWTFISEGATVPIDGAQLVTVTAPFAFRGSFDLTWCDIGCGGGLFMRRTGGGLATIQLELTNAGYVIRPGTALSYSFSANATPEPASFLLLATGIAGVLTRRRQTFA